MPCPIPITSLLPICSISWAKAESPGAAPGRGNPKSEDGKTTFFAVGYSNQTRTPTWTAFEVENPGGPILNCERDDQFEPEPQADPVITHRDYSKTGYSHSHMVPNAAMAYWKDCEANKATFITSNIALQLQPYNGGVWEALKTAVAGEKTGGDKFNAGLIGRSMHVWVFAGPVFWGRTADIEKVGQKEIWVPIIF